MKDIVYVDACCYLGRHVRMPGNQPETPEALLAAMDHFGIHDALVVDTLSREANPMAGNERILVRTRSYPRLHPAWAGLMPHSRELPPPRDLVAQMRQHGVGALFLFYGQFDIRLEDWGVDDLFAELESARVPVFLCPNNWREPGRIDATDWAGIVKVGRRFPCLPLVITEHRIYKSQRALYAALNACPSLKVDMSALWLHKCVEFICREFGAERIVWGSQMPERSPAPPLTQLAYSDLSSDQLSLIAGGNLRQLLSWNESIRLVGSGATLARPVDSLHRAARERESLAQQEFYDCHGHIGGCSPHHVISDSPADLVREMDKFGVRVCCVFSLEGVFGDETYGNDRVVEAVRRFPDRFIGFTLLNLNHGDSLVRQEMERGAAMGMKGIKLINAYHGYPAEGPLIDVACEFAHRHRLIILNHHWGSPEQIERFCRTYPNACFITGHSLGNYGEVVKRVRNLFICTCPFLAWGQTEQFVKIYGADRLLFGSDLTDLPIGWGLGPILHARIPESDKRKILGENLKSILQDMKYL